MLLLQTFLYHAVAGHELVATRTPTTGGSGVVSTMGSGGVMLVSSRVGPHILNAPDLIEVLNEGVMRHVVWQVGLGMGRSRRV